jgi:hypothetical protein
VIFIYLKLCLSFDDEQAKRKSKKVPNKKKKNNLEDDFQELMGDDFQIYEEDSFDSDGEFAELGFSKEELVELTKDDDLEEEALRMIQENIGKDATEQDLIELIFKKKKQILKKVNHQKFQCNLFQIHPHLLKRTNHQKIQNILLQIHSYLLKKTKNQKVQKKNKFLQVQPNLLK